MFRGVGPAELIGRPWCRLTWYGLFTQVVVFVPGTKVELLFMITVTV
jgi:hypothetical protein